MKDDTSRGWSRRRPAVLAGAIGGVAMLAAACGSSTTTAAPSSSYSRAFSYANCMRSHGEPKWPDPSQQGAFNTAGINTGSAQEQAANSACQYLLSAAGGSGPDAAQEQALLRAGLKYSGCMRSHGIPSFPDPHSRNGVGVWFTLNGLDVNGQAFKAAQTACAPFSIRRAKL